MDLFKDVNYRRALLVDRYENPRFLITEAKAKQLKNDYALVNANSESCIDNFKVYIKNSDNVIKDIKYLGDGCVIAISSTDFLVEALINKTKKEASEILQQFLNLINNQKPFNEKKIPEFLNLYNQVYKQSNRIKCASLVSFNLLEFLKVY